MSLFKKTLKVVTHGGNFHADDVFACATLLIWAEKNNKKLKIIRSREKEKIEKADIVVDVGGIYNPIENKFDHHQKGRAGQRENGVPYASLGLIWKKYGEIICGEKQVADRIEKILVLPIDARDNGINILNTNELNIIDHRTSNMIYDFNPTFLEPEKTYNKQFEKVLYLARDILKREIAWIKALDCSERETEKIIKEQNEPSILILEKDIEWQEAVSKNKKIKLVIYPREEKDEWGIQVARDNLEDYQSDRVKFPKDWWGRRGEDLVNVSGVKGAAFCAPDGWIAAVKTKEGAIEMANKTLQIGQN